MIRSVATTLAVVGLAGCLAVGAARDAVPLPDTPSLLVTVGDVTDSTAVLWLRGHSPGAVHARYGPVGEGEESTAQVPVTPATDLTGKVMLATLAPATRYRYRLMVDVRIAKSVGLGAQMRWRIGGCRRSADSARGL